MLIDNSLESVKPLLSEHVSLSIWQLNIFRIKVFSFWLLSVEPKMIKKEKKKKPVFLVVEVIFRKHGSDHALSWLNPSTDFPPVSE